MLDGKRVLIIKPSSLGDVVHTVPVAHAIKRRYPTCHIGWVVQRTFRAILECDPAVDEIIPVFIPSTSDPLALRGAFLAAARATVSTIRELRARFREAAYDVVLDLHASFRSGLLALSNPGGLRIGFADAKELNTSFQHRTVSTDPGKPHAVDKNLAFAEYVGCPVEPEDLRVCVSTEARDQARAFLAAAGVRPGQRIVYANPATRWATKFWTVHGWATLADRLAADAGACVVFSGGPGDVPYIEGIAARMKRPCLIAAGALSLAEATGLLELADVYVGVDSGPMHISAFVGTPVVAIFGPTDPAKVGPYGPGHRVIRQDDLTCLACRKRSCDDRTCMEGISADRVFAETMSLMKC
jgi:heptosyltransferase I